MPDRDGNTVPPAQRELLDGADLELLREHLAPKYTIDRKIGAGGMADVYFGRHTLLHRNVAIKVLPRIYCRDEMLVKRFMQEAENSARLDHPNIIKIYDIGIHWPLHFFIMAYAPGGTLKDRLRAQGKIEPAAAARIVAAIAHGLQYAHDKGVIHRDIKPDNVMFDEDGHPILTDFGIAKAKFASRMTATGTLIGTPHYMSPEQLRGQEVDNRSDIYSLGIMFYEILTGAVPFDAGDTYGVGLKHIQEAPVPPTEKDPGIPGPLSDLILTMLAKLPDARFQNAGEVAAALHAMFDRAGGFAPDPEKIVELSRRAKSAEETSRLNTQQLQEQFALLKETLERTQAAGKEPEGRIVSNTLTMHDEPPQTDVPAATVVRETPGFPESPFTRKTVEIPIEEMRSGPKPVAVAQKPNRMPLVIGGGVVLAILVIILVIVFFPPAPLQPPQELPPIAARTDLPPVIIDADAGADPGINPAGDGAMETVEDAEAEGTSRPSQPGTALPNRGGVRRSEVPSEQPRTVEGEATASEPIARDTSSIEAANVAIPAGQIPGNKSADPGNGRNGRASGERAGTVLPAIIESSEADDKPTVKFTVRPTLPAKARIMRQSGQVVVRLLIETDGSYQVIGIIEETPPNFGFADAALKYLEKSRWTPARKGGAPVRVHHNLILRFDAN